MGVIVFRVMDQCTKKTSNNSWGKERGTKSNGTVFFLGEGGGISPNKTWFEGWAQFISYCSSVSKQPQLPKSIKTGSKLIFPPQRTLLLKGFGWVAIQPRDSHSDSRHMNNTARGNRRTPSDASFSAPNAARPERETRVEIQSSSHVNTLTLMRSIWDLSLTVLASQRSSSHLNKRRQNHSLLKWVGDTGDASPVIILGPETDRGFCYISVTPDGTRPIRFTVRGFIHLSSLNALTLVLCLGLLHPL